MFYVYVLRSHKDTSLYIGLTNNLARRLMQHNKGQARSTRTRAPFELLLSEPFSTREAARSRERFYKTGFGRELLKGSFGK